MVEAEVAKINVIIFCVIHWSLSAWKNKNIRQEASPDLFYILQSAPTFLVTQKSIVTQSYMFLILLETSKALKKLVKQQITGQQLQVKKRTKHNIQWLKMTRDFKTDSRFSSPRQKRSV